MRRTACWSREAPAESGAEGDAGAGAAGIGPGGDGARRPNRRALAGFDGHQGVLLEVGERRWADLGGDPGARRERPAATRSSCVLEHLQDPTNFGTLLRSAEAAGVDGVIFPERGAAPLSAAAVKASAGASEHLLLARVDSLGAGDARAEGARVRLVAADQDAPAYRLGDGPARVRWRWSSAARGAGSRARRGAGCDLLVSFPMSGQRGVA